MLNVPKALVFSDDLVGLNVRDEDLFHLKNVLRLNDGETVTVSDGISSYVKCEWSNNRENYLIKVSEIENFSPPTPPITVGFSLVKGERNDWCIQKLTEIGVDRILPFISSRTILKWDQIKMIKSLTRWKTIAREASSQSKRLSIPEIIDVQQFQDVIKFVGDIQYVGICDSSGTNLDNKITTLLVGPEGGFEPNELSQFPLKIRLGPNVLRTETAAISAAVLLVNGGR